MTPEELIERAASDFITGDDGWVVYWPKDSNGALSAWQMRVIAEELDRRNAQWDTEVAEHFRKGEER
jgi:hypothetical protein